MPAVPTVSITPAQLTRFERALGRIVKEEGGEVVFVVFKTAVDLFRDITIGTPRRTGRAAAAWTVFFDRIGRPLSIRGPRVQSSAVMLGKSEGEARTNLPPSAGTRAGARAPLPPDVKRRSPLDRPFAELRNNVKYILPLEYGWTTRGGRRVVSRQAPAGFVRHNVRRHARYFLTGMKTRRRV